VKVIVCPQAIEVLVATLADVTVARFLKKTAEHERNCANERERKQETCKCVETENA